jgi:acetyl-CoA acyltransferase
LVELNEAFASQAIYSIRELGINPDIVNVNGGAIAIGHPLGCTGAKLTVTLMHEMERRNVKYGIVSMCIGGGMGAAGIFELCK